MSDIEEEKRENREKTEKRTGKEELARAGVSASVSKFSCGLKNVRSRGCRAFGDSKRRERRERRERTAFTGEPPVHRAGAPEHEGVGLTPLGSKLATDWLAVYDAQLKSARSERGGARHRDAATAKGRRRTCAVVLRSADLPASTNSTNFARHSVCGREAERADFEVSPAERPRASRCYMHADDAAPSRLVTMLRNAELGFSSGPTQPTPTPTPTPTATATMEMAGRAAGLSRRLEALVSALAKLLKVGIRKRQRSGGTFYDRVFESCDSCVVCTSGLNS
ncbi:hypothetical protein G5I_04267 [Acromyrmex echinatior]|uniref:Uncharacterized protein n=1 Tax=Acromyrmex echinatior TaxID=103372 RepID=F4WF60_ACREC|nr:hypothetical protein G5I_04267 [Acromyrmex echinatior]